MEDKKKVLRRSARLQAKKVAKTAGIKCVCCKCPTEPLLKPVHGKTWSPPKSPHKLIQEKLYSNPWKLLLASIFLNKAPENAVVPVIHRFFKKWRSPEALIAADLDEVEKVIRPLRYKTKRAPTLRRFSEEYLQRNWVYPIELHGIKKYGDDCYRIFCINDWKSVNPDDQKLIQYIEFLREKDYE